MTEISAPSSALASTSSAITGSTTPWRQLLRVAAVTTIVASVVMMSLGRFVGPSLVVLDLVMAIGWWMLRRPGPAGVLVVGLFSLANLVMHGAIVALQLSLPESPANFVAGLALGLASLLGVAGTVPALRGRPHLRTTGKDLVLRGGAVVLVGVALVPLATSRRITFTAATGTYRFYHNATATTPTRGELVVAT